MTFPLQKYCTEEMTVGGEEQTAWQAATRGDERHSPVAMAKVMARARATTRPPQKNSCRNDSNAGFGLLETMIAVAILALIGTLLGGVFSQAAKSRRRGTEVSARYHEIRQALVRMVREIETAYITEHRDCDDPKTKTIFKTSRTGGGMRIDFASFSHVKLRADANESDQHELSYFLGNDPEHTGSTALLRREQHRIDDDPEEGGSEDVLLTDVSALEFEFYNAKEDRWEDDWDTTDSEFKGRLPAYVSISMSAKGPGGEDEKFTTKARIFLRHAIFLTGFIKCQDS